MYVMRLWLTARRSNNNKRDKQQDNHPLQTLHCTDCVPEPGDHVQDLVARVNKRIQHKHIKGLQIIHFVLLTFSYFIILITFLRTYLIHRVRLLNPRRKVALRCGDVCLFVCLSKAV